MAKLKRKTANGKKKTVAAKRKRKLTWAVRLRMAESTSKFTPRDVDAANNICRCAVGERVRKEGFHTNNNWAVEGIISQRTDKLSMEFYYAVESQDVAEARRIFNQIRGMTREEFLKPVFAK